MNTFSFHRNSLCSFSPSPPPLSPHYFSLFEPQISSIRWVETFLSSPSFYAWRNWGTWTVTNLPKVTLSGFWTQIQCVCGEWEGGEFPHTDKKFSKHQLHVLQFNSILTLSIQKSVRFHRLRTQFYKTAPLCPLLQMAVSPPGCYLCFWSTGYESEAPTIHLLSFN